MGTRIVVMKDGIIQQVDTPLNIYNAPSNLFVAGFIGSPQMNLINGLVIEEDGSLYCKFENNKVLLAEEKAKILKEKGYVNKEVVFGIRPEHLSENESIVKDADKCSISGNVEVVERMGAESFIYFKSGNSSLTAKVEGSTTIESKDTIVLYVQNDKIHIFDKDSELRIC